MNVIITEKPSVARQFCQALGIPATDKEKKGYYEGRGKDGNDYKITYAIGHLIGMSYPERYDETMKNWLPAESAIILLAMERTPLS